MHLLSLMHPQHFTALLRGGEPSAMAPYKPINPTGFNCVNVLVQRAIGKVKTKAKNRASTREWTKANPQRKKAADSVCYERKRSVVIARSVKWNSTNREKRNVRLRPKAREYVKDRRTNNPTASAAFRMRSRLSNAIKAAGSKKAGRTLALLGCSADYLAEHLGDMAVGDQVDHIFPFARYDLLDVEQQKRVMHFSNTQPLSKTENRSKMDKLPTKAMAAKVERWAWPPGVTEDMLPEVYDGWSTPLRM